MVKLQEVEDEHFVQDQPAPASTSALPKGVVLAEEDEDDMAYSDTDSSITGSSASDRDDDDDDDPSSLDESLLERFIALRDMIPPKRRAALSSSIHTGTDWFRTGLRWGGQTLYVVSTSVILVGLTWTMAFVDDAQAAEAEKEMRMQQSANEILAPGVATNLGQASSGDGEGPKR